MDKAQLVTPRLQHEDVEIPGVGTVRVRGLTRGELAQTQGLDGPEAERVSLSIGMVDPQLTREEVDAWLDNSPAMECQPVVNAINRLSGMSRAVLKEAYKSAGVESGS